MCPVCVLPHIKKLDDALGDFIVRVTCPCGASRHIEPEALARIVGKISDARCARAPNALFSVREEGCRGGRGGTLEAARARTVAAQVSQAHRSRPAGKRSRMTRRRVIRAAR
jgi:hypothetical protein